MALKGLQVIELAGLAPGPFCGMILGDFGAKVIRIDKFGTDTDYDCLANGKKSVCLNLKDERAVHIIKTLSRNADVLIEPFRPGVMEKLGLGPEKLMKDNPSLIYARLTGYGHSGCFAKKAGHDINYVALSGLLSLFGGRGNPFPPINLLADFGGGGLMCAFGILLAVIERSKSGLGQVVDTAMVHGAAYLGSWIYRSQSLPVWGQGRGENILDGGAHFYDVYKTKDGKFMSVGAIEHQFYAQLVAALGLTEDESPQLGDFDGIKRVFTVKFLEKTRDEWCQIFSSVDACVAPVLELSEAPKYQHNAEQSIFVDGANGPTPQPAPLLSRTPGHTLAIHDCPVIGEHTEEVLLSLGYSKDDIANLEQEDVAQCYRKSKL